MADTKLLWVGWLTGDYAILDPDNEGRCACLAIKPRSPRRQGGYDLWFNPLGAPPECLGWFPTNRGAKDFAADQHAARHFESVLIAAAGLGQP